MHRESPATRAAFRQVQPSQREGQLDDDADYQSAYQSVRSTSHMQAHLRPLPALRAGKSRHPTVDGMEAVSGLVAGGTRDPDRAASLVKRISTRGRSLDGSADGNRATLTRTLVTG
jgi:hypothetical protein